MRLWDFATRLYADPQVEAACLSLQDDHGQCVSFLIWRLWALKEGRPVDARLLGDAVLTARTWETAATAPLRAVRRRLKTLPSTIPADGQGRLRQAILAAELESERLLLEALETATPETSGLVPGAERALAAAALAWGGAKAPPLKLLKVLAGAIA
ncbi:TIGR02444 family protein [Caulobacter sp. KR2-114]|uniref:TIGR02444 family protein n=1 Tax=Caulobacter sp. KR2-114 TaxID=3400912 RepID=UPI003C107803